MKKIRALFISYYYPPAGGKGLPASQRSIKFIRHMKYAESIHVLSIKPEKYSEEIMRNYNLALPVNGEIISRTGATDFFQMAMKVRKQAKSLLGCGSKQSPIRAMPANETHHVGRNAKNQSLFQKIKDFIHYAYYIPDLESPWIRKAVKTGINLINNHKCNVIFATGSPWSALVVGKHISSKTGVPFIADFRDPWVGNPFRKSNGRFIDWRHAQLEKSIVKKAALITANTEPLRGEFLKRYPLISHNKILTLPNGFDLIDFEFINKKAPKRKNDSSKLILAHAGFLYGKRDPAPLLQAMESLFERYPKCRDMVEFHQIGDIDLDYSFYERYDRLIREGNIKVIDQMPYQECLNRLSGYDILVLIQPGTKTQVPSKLYDYLCLGKPIFTVTPLDGALGKMVSKHQLGDLVSPDSHEEIVQTLYELYKRKESEGELTAEYKEKDRFDVRSLTKLLEEKMAEIVSD